MDAAAEVERFAVAASEHGRFTIEGDSEACNSAYDRIVRSAIELRKSEDRGQASFERLLFHPEASVRIWAASYLLALNESAALKILSNAASGSGLVALSAEMTIKEWKAGRLKVF